MRCNNILMILLATSLTACSGGSGSSNPPAPDTGRQINGINVPDQPTPAQANATLAGVDTNANGVRDEVDRALASSYGTTAAHYNAAMTYAVNAQKWLANEPVTQEQAQAAIAKELAIFTCLKSQVGVDTARIIVQEVDLRTFNIRSRMLERQRLLQIAGVFELPISGGGSC
jgi:hypothetical protein